MDEEQQKEHPSSEVTQSTDPEEMPTNHPGHVTSVGTDPVTNSGPNHLNKNTCTPSWLGSLQELLHDITQLEATMNDSKKTFEALYTKLKDSLYKKVQSVKHIEMEMAWLTNECDNLDKSCKDISLQRDCREMEMKKLLGDIINVDIEEASASLPKIYNQYMELRSVEGSNKLLADIETTKNNLAKFEHLIKMKQQRMKKGDSAVGRNRMVHTDAFLKSLLERMTNNLDIQMRDAQSSSTRRTSTNRSERNEAGASSTSTAQLVVTTTQTAVTSSLTNPLTSTTTVTPDLSTAPRATADAIGMLSSALTDHWVNEYREAMETTIPPPNLLTDILTADEFMSAEPQLSEVDSVIPDEFSIIL